MDKSPHLKSYERGKFKVANFPNMLAKLIHQIWDEMVIVIIIKKDNRMVTTSKTVQTDVEGSSIIRAPKKQKGETTIEEKKEKMIDNLVVKKYPKGLDKTECKHVDELIRNEFLDCFPFGNKHVEGVKVPLDRFLPPLGRIVYCPLSNTHKNKIKSNSNVPLHQAIVSNFCYSN